MKILLKEMFSYKNLKDKIDTFLMIIRRTRSVESRSVRPNSAAFSANRSRPSDAQAPTQVGVTSRSVNTFIDRALNMGLDVKYPLFGELNRPFKTDEIIAKRFL